MNITTKDPIERVETGRLVINNDHAGLFIRGDDCMGFTIYTSSLLNCIKDTKLDIMSQFAIRMLENYCKIIITKVAKMSRPNLIDQAKLLVKENNERYQIVNIAQCINTYENTINYLSKHNPDKVEEINNVYKEAEKNGSMEDFMALKEKCSEVLKEVKAGIIGGTPWLLT